MQDPKLIAVHRAPTFTPSGDFESPIHISAQRNPTGTRGEYMNSVQTLSRGQDRAYNGALSKYLHNSIQYEMFQSYRGWPGLCVIITCLVHFYQVFSHKFD